MNDFDNDGFGFESEDDAEDVFNEVPLLDGNYLQPLDDINVADLISAVSNRCENGNLNAIAVNQENNIAQTIEQSDVVVENIQALQNDDEVVEPLILNEENDVPIPNENPIQLLQEAMPPPPPSIL